MPKLSGNNLISDLTEKYGRRLIAISFLAILVKAYNVNLDNLSVFGLSLPSELFDVVALSLIVYFIYALIVNWVGDLAAFRFWFESNNITSEFGTEMKTDKGFVNGGAKLIKKLYALEKGQEWPENFDGIDSELKSDFREFKANVELYSVRLDAAGTKFSALSIYGHIYVWFQSFALPIGLSLIALYFIFCTALVPVISPQ
ncbi:hypothetical protein [Chlorobium sp. N1]|uniref:hypothetical protein n=1 Tax=Chlorobium sp. N1 TaxID=2491138 RepID=UPI0010389095|nr:hypothetical protein [Chlorobium sp. N1]TCD48397.1 hypothetical protein E0L29_00445 [Chlorobium sp. N1]